jgi:transcriptional regulator with XRE-family HTH domain
MDELFLQIGHRIREKRDYLGISRETFSEIIGISPRFLAQIESGQRGMSFPTLCKICEGLKVSSDFILMGKEGKNDVSNLTEILSNMDAKYLPYIEGVIKSLILVLSQK